MIDYKISRQRKRNCRLTPLFSQIDFLVIGAGCASGGTAVAVSSHVNATCVKNLPRRLELFAGCDWGCPASSPCRIGRFFAAGLMRKRDAVAVFSKTEETHTPALCGAFGGGVYIMIAPRHHISHSSSASSLCIASAYFMRCERCKNRRPLAYFFAGPCAR